MAVAAPKLNLLDRQPARESAKPADPERTVAALRRAAAARNLDDLKRKIAAGRISCGDGAAAHRRT